jgi:hypothetical protein
MGRRGCPSVSQHGFGSLREAFTKVPSWSRIGVPLNGGMFCRISGTVPSTVRIPSCFTVNSALFGVPNRLSSSWWRRKHLPTSQQPTLPRHFRRSSALDTPFRLLGRAADSRAFPSACRRRVPARGIQKTSLLST